MDGDLGMTNYGTPKADFLEEAMGILDAAKERDNHTLDGGGGHASSLPGLGGAS